MFVCGHRGLFGIWNWLLESHPLVTDVVVDCQKQTNSDVQVWRTD